MAVIVSVAVFCPLRQCFSYLWPDEFGEVCCGVRVRVPFGRSDKSLRNGVVVAINIAQPDAKITLKEINDVLDVTALFDKHRNHWLQRLANYYLAPLGQMYEIAYAFSKVEETRRWRCLQQDILADTDAEIADSFKKRPVSLQSLRKRLPTKATMWRMHQAANKGLLEAMPSSSADSQNSHTLQEPHQCNSAQSAAVITIKKAIDSHLFSPFLLFGPTGSGKTEVYLQAASYCVQQGGQILVLAPEIGLTPQWLSRLQARFSNHKVALWHSAISKPQRLAVLDVLADIDVLIGTRSALFLPLPRLQLLVVDEEHDASFKQQDIVCYCARDAAVLLAQEMAIPIILGTATPSMESWRQVQRGKYELLKLDKRIAKHAEVGIQIIDVRRYNDNNNGNNKYDPITPPLLAALSACHNSGEQALLYLNRRGYSPALQCYACGSPLECVHCSLTLCLHRKQGILRCHNCDYSRSIPNVCNLCGEQALLPLGVGTERLAEQLSAVMPTLRFAMMDRDAVRSHKDLLQVLQDFSTQKIDCLIGTQMLVKGHHFPHVTLVGVINADQGLSLPDFRAAERWWQQLTQVMGRAGRGSKAGKVLIQTRNPENHWLKLIGDSHAETVLSEETNMRQRWQTPPYARWIRVLFSGRSEKNTLQAAQQFALYLHQAKLPDAIKCSPPSPAIIERLAGLYRYELLLRDPDLRSLPWQLHPILRNYKPPYAVRVKIDVDPRDMM
ncbi:MAG: primosomal protein N' [Mariprofundales bacterium]